MTTATTDLTANPLYLHPSDNPGAVLVSQVLDESGNNFSSWIRAMTIALGAKNKLGLVDGTIAKPNASASDFAAWNRSNHMTTSWILNSIAKELHSSVIYAESAAAIWKELKTRFSQGNGPRIFQLNKEVLNCTQGTLSVSAYFSKFKGLWDSLAEHNPANTCNCGGSDALVAYLKRQYVYIFLVGLNESFSHIRGQILAMEPLPDITKVFSLVIQDEKQREIGVNTAESLSQMACAVANQSKNTKKDRPLCSHCGMSGHVKEKCFKLHGYPPGYKKQRSANTFKPILQVTANATSADEPHLDVQQYQQLIQFMQAQMAKASDNADSSATGMTHPLSCSFQSLYLAFSILHYYDWIIDSGATAHICSLLSSFSTYTKLHNTFVTLPNNQRVPVIARDCQIGFWPNS